MKGPRWSRIDLALAVETRVGGELAKIESFCRDGRRGMEGTGNAWIAIRKEAVAAAVTVKRWGDEA